MRYRELPKNNCGNYFIRKGDLYRFAFSGYIKVTKDMIGKKMGHIAGSTTFYRPLKRKLRSTNKG